MCGIAGIWKGDGDETPVRQMLSQLVYRGPDAHGLHRDRSAVLGHRRLSIMDPEGGTQPIYNEDGTHAIAGNGEIYNFRELTWQIGSRHTFKTTNDTAAALHVYEEAGVGRSENLSESQAGRRQRGKRRPRNG